MIAEAFLVNEIFRAGFIGAVVLEAAIQGLGLRHIRV